MRQQSNNDEDGGAGDNNNKNNVKMFGAKKDRKQPVIVKGLGKKPTQEVELQDWGGSRRRCILCVGSSGSGKDSTIDLFVANDSSPSSSSSSQFRVVQDDSRCWVDTNIDWQAKSLDLSSVQESLLKFLEEEDIHQLDAFMWTIQPSRSDSAVERQAKFLDMFRPSEVWANVIVVCKESMRPNRDGAEAIKAAKDLNGVPKKVLGYRCYSGLDPDLREKVDAEAKAKEEFNVKTDEEVRESLLVALGECGENPVQVFNKEEVEDLFPQENQEQGRIDSLLGLPPLVFAKPF